MGQTKKLLLNGVVVGEIAATGDLEQDLAAANAVFKAKGLDKETSVPQAMLMQATSFCTAARDLYVNYLMKSPYNGYAIAPFLVNSSFSVEIYLKTLHAAAGAPKKGHGLIALYDALPAPIKDEIERAAKPLAQSYGVENPSPLRSHIAQFNNAFEQWRYAYEYDRLGVINTQPMLLAMHALHDVCNIHVYNQKS